jgi:hypothetical protein
MLYCTNCSTTVNYPRTQSASNHINRQNSLFYTIFLKNLLDTVYSIPQDTIRESSRFQK